MAKTGKIAYKTGSFLAAFFLLFTLAAPAQTLPLTSYTSANGLAHDYVGKIVRDSRGFMWFCTGEGLSRFDGYEFKTYTQADGLPHRSINDIVELVDGRFLVATNDGLTLFDPNGFSQKAGQTDSVPMFRTFRSPDMVDDRKAAAVNALYFARDGRIWMGTMNGFYEVLLTGDSVELRRIENALWPRKGKLLEFVGILEDGENCLWLAMSDDLYRYNPASDELVQVPQVPGGRALIEDTGGNIWVGGGEKDGLGLSRYSITPGHLSPKREESFSVKDGLNLSGWYNAKLITSDGRLLIGQPAGVTEYYPDAREGQQKFKLIVPDADVVSLAEDRAGNIWIGTATRGALKLARRGFEVFGEKQGIPPGLISSVIPGEAGEIFASIGDYEMLHFDGTRFDRIIPAGMKKRSWGWGQIDLRSQVDGDWWIATATGVLRYSNVNKFPDLASHAPSRVYGGADGLYTEEVFRMYEDSRGDIWIHTFGKASDPAAYLYLWERANDKIRRFSSDEGLPPASNVTAFAEDGKGGVWLGSYNGGVTLYRNGKFRQFAVADGFPKGFVNAIYTDKTGRIWIATGNSGIVRVDDPGADEPAFVNISAAQGLSSDQTVCVTEDPIGRIYIGTGRGITRLEPDTGRMKIYSQADGLPFSSVRTCGSDRAGNLWFVQNKVIARLRPETEEAHAAPPVFIGDLRVNGETVRKLSELGEKAVSGLDLASDQRQLQIGYFALGFGTGERLLYQYKLDGIDQNWSEPSAQRVVNLNLSPGDYRFLVRAVNADGIASDTPAALAFTIARPVWQRWWFVLIAAIAVFCVVYFSYRYRLRRLLELERVRTRIATDLHDDIGSSLSQIAILSEVVRQKSGTNGTSEPLAMIADTSREMVDSMSDIVWAINPQKDHLSDLAHRMRRFASDLLDAADISYRFNLPDGEIDIPLGADVRREVYLIFKECLNNAVKHSGASEISISVSLQNGELGIGVRDNGLGFVVESKLNGHPDGLGGNGLINIKRRAEKLGGRFSIDSVPDGGTDLALRIPLRRARWFDKERSS